MILPQAVAGVPLPPAIAITGFAALRRPSFAGLFLLCLKVGTDLPWILLEVGEENLCLPEGAGEG